MAEALVTLTVQSLAGTCAAAPAVLVPPKTFPLVVPSKGKGTFQFQVTFDCTNDPGVNAAGDFRVTATVQRPALDGVPDTDPIDDVRPRTVFAPAPSRSGPGRQARDLACGPEKTDKPFGADVLGDVVAKSASSPAGVARPARRRRGKQRGLGPLWRAGQAPSRLGGSAASGLASVPARDSGLYSGVMERTR
jgi:hypothetical protein